MASLTPGVLSKLLRNAGNGDSKVAGEHRSPLLQVLEIVPSLPAAGEEEDDPWKSRGFFLKVSDSLHSAFVSVSDDEVDLIYSNKIQLGQFVYVTRLDSATSGCSVPVVRGLKPLPKRRPCVGTPSDLVSSDALPIGPGIDFRQAKCKSKDRLKGFKPKKVVSDNSGSIKSGRASFSVDGVDRNKNPKIVEVRRFSLDSTRRAWDDNNPSSNGTPKGSKTPPVGSSHVSSPVICSGNSTPKKISVAKRPSLIKSPLRNKNEIDSSKTVSRIAKKSVKSQDARNVPIPLFKLPLKLENCSSQRISWNVLPSSLCDLGKRTVRNRNLAFTAAVCAVEEASAMEAVISCMCKFAELSESSQKMSGGHLVEQYLDLHSQTWQALRAVNSLLDRMLPFTNSSRSDNATSWVQAAVGTNLSNFRLFRMPSQSDVQNGGKYHYIVLESPSKQLDSENTTSQVKQGVRNDRTVLSDSGAKRLPSPATQSRSATKEGRKEMQSNGSGLKEAANLAAKLLMVSRDWFLKYLKKLSGAGFSLSRVEGSSEIAHLLRQLKRVNQWLDDMIGSGLEVHDSVQDLKKKLDQFLMDRVELAVSSK